MQERLYHGRKFENVEQLKQAIVLEWRAHCHRGSLMAVGPSTSGGVVCRLSYRRMVNGGHIEQVQLAVDICTL